MKRCARKMKQPMRLREPRSTFLCNKPLRLTPKLYLRNREEPKRRRMKTMPLLNISAKRMQLNLRPNKSIKGRRKRKNVKFRDLENFKKKLPIDKLRLMPLEPKEHLRREKEEPEKEKSLNRPRG